MELYSELLELLDPEQTVYIGERHQPLTIEASRWKQDLLLLKFRSLDDRTAVEPLTNALVYVESDQLPSLEAGEYYYHQLIGLKIYDEAGDYLGILTEVLQTGANDVYLVTNEAGEETLIPDTEEAVLEIDVDHSRMTVAKLKWYGEGD